MNCNCIKELDVKLKAQNLRVSGKCLGFRMPAFKLCIFIPLDWLNKKFAPKGKKNNPPPMFASFCPFCGVKAEQDSNPKANQ